MESIVDGPIISRGTYVHPLLIPHIASWVSAEFAIRVSQIVNNFIVREYKEQIRIKDTRIDELLSEVKSQTLIMNQQNTHLRQQNDHIRQQTGQIQLLLAEVGELSERLDVSNENVVSVLDKLGSVSQHSVPYDRIPPRNRDCFVLIYTNENDSLPYQAIRAQRHVCQEAIRRKRKTCPELREVIFIEAQPNAREFYIAFRRSALDLIFVRGNKFCLEDGVTEERIVQLIENINAEKLEDYQQEKSRLNEPIEDSDSAERSGRQPEPQANEEGAAEQPRPSLSVSSLMLRTMKSLQTMARECKLRGWSKMRKPELAEFIVKNI